MSTDGSGYTRAADSAERLATSHAVCGQLVTMVRSLLDGGSHNFDALGFGALPEFTGKTREEMSAILGAAASDMAVDTAWHDGKANNYRSLAAKEQPSTLN